MFHTITDNLDGLVKTIVVLMILSAHFKLLESIAKEQRQANRLLGLLLEALRDKPY